MRLTAVGTVCVLLMAASAAAAPAPDVIFIIADDLGWGDVGFHGGSAPTPHLDRLARDGLELGCHLVAPVCSPTRAALLTGRCWSRFGVVDPQNERALPWDTLTLPRALDAAGYDTALVGKWHLGSLPEERPNRFGFDTSYGSIAGGVTWFTHRSKNGPFTHTGHRDGTLVVFTSDNDGTTVANTGQDYPPDGSPPGVIPGKNPPFRGAKQTLYDGGVRVPAVVSWPGHVARDNDARATTDR